VCEEETLADDDPPPEENDFHQVFREWVVVAFESLSSDEVGGKLWWITDWRGWRGGLVGSVVVLVVVVVAGRGVCSELVRANEVAGLLLVEDLEAVRPSASGTSSEDPVVP
jgi:hypothetical protein